jgi:hypothetical protein
VFLAIGMSVPVMLGWLVLACTEGAHPVLGRLERAAWSMALGPTVFLLAVTLTHWAGLIRLDLPGFCIVAGILAVALIAVGVRTGALRAAWRLQPAQHPSAPVSRGAMVVIGMLIAWTCIKLVAGGYNLLTVPTYWDDSFNNWNMRGKMFYVQHELVLNIPVGNGTVQTEGGVSSYPPTVPLMKTWLALLRGSWDEPLVNGVNILTVLTTGKVGIGTNSPANDLVLVSESTASRGLNISQINTGVNAPVFDFRKARGTTGGLTTVVDGDYTSVTNFYAYDGTSYLDAAIMGTRVNGTVSTGRAPTDIFFGTNNGASDTNPYANNGIRLLISSNGNIGINTTSPIARLAIQAASSSNPFIIASSTGTNIVTVFNTGVFGVNTNTPQYTMSVGAHSVLAVCLVCKMSP